MGFDPQCTSTPTVQIGTSSYSLVFDNGQECKATNLDVLYFHKAGTHRATREPALRAYPNATIACRNNAARATASQRSSIFGVPLRRLRKSGTVTAVVRPAWVVRFAIAADLVPAFDKP